MSIQASTFLRGVASMPLLSGAAILAMGLQVIPADPQMSAVANVFIEGILPLSTFLTMLGAGKMMAALSLWGYGPMPHDLAVVGLSIPPLCAMYGHAVAEGAAAALPPAIYLALLAAYFVKNKEQSNTSDGKKDE
ncbi:expressed unknown protein [Seminavis robusta]|uniref:Uncharacterized protein n=1 Tax=Seminavis robusta TaxID=568900 RepID=A0A9N8H726_9STRA|nr:expressed unknown protein [Seminavis robusta]|eukprot:Sro58_g033860.1 n/a (135) ;mRNA; r:109853-110257